ncbi:MAG: 3-(methylthio)propionyl-CoA ligase [Proteobacteria bacterium]|nr:3-(methylthio)propionyl-CoA ligase [Pseudomonadota bacterium]MDA1057402.1 3-(methylthio)propionyl-CoA ligase [Pseudomonadota bacterium]
MLQGDMMDRPLLLSSLIEFAALYHGEREIVSRTAEGTIHRYNYAAAGRRVKQLANALRRLNVEEGERIGTLAWNTYRHFEIYFAVSGMGSVCHTINPRLFTDQIAYIGNHAEDRIIFVDLPFVALAEQLAPQLPLVRAFVVMTDRAHMPETSLPGALCYEDLLTAESEVLEWPTFDENTAAALCYTSGTTGDPKGVLYSHRSTMLHSFASCMGDVLGIRARDSILVVVPMFHVNAWGIPYCAAMTGAKLVFPGAALDGASVHELMESEAVTLSAGVPTVWLLLLQYLRDTGNSLPHLERVVCGGSAAPRAMIQEFEEVHDVRLLHAWGMTEMNPVGVVNTPKPVLEALEGDAKLDLMAKQGRAIFGVDLKIVDDSGQELARDGKAFGALKVRGPWVARRYFQRDDDPAFDSDGWFSTGDVCTIDPDGFIQIVDRTKDVIKSGGEWISSIELENIAVGHPAVAEACVIGVPHPKWDERPLLVVVPSKGATPSKEDVMSVFAGKVAKWWLPDDVVFTDELPHTATGKLLKTELRQRYKDYKLPSA